MKDAAAVTMTVASAPCSFGVDEILVDDAWMPGPEDLLDWIVDTGYVGTELGPPGYLGNGAQVRERLTARGLRLVGAFLPQRFSYSEHVAEDQAWLRRSLALIRDATPPDSRPFAVLADGIDEPARRALAGSIPVHPEAWLSGDRFSTLIDNLHRAAEICQHEGFQPVVHPHAGTYIETADEIARLVDRMDPSLVGLCLDTGHFRFGGADPVKSVNEYHEVVRHVHVKDCRTSVIDRVSHTGGGLEAALSAGVFCALGEGDSDIDGAIAALRDHDYRGWLVVEQDQFLRETDTPASVVAGQRRNREYLQRLGI